MENSVMKTRTGSAPAVASALRILELLQDSMPQQVGLSEIAKRLDLNKATTHRILNELRAMDYVMQHGWNRRYGLGPAIMRFSASPTEPDALAVVQAILPALAQRAGWLASAWKVLPDDRIQMVAQAPAPALLQMTYPLGVTIPIVPPVAVLERAWDDPEGIARWRESLAARGTRFNDREWTYVLTHLRWVRESGYAWTALATPSSSRKAIEIADWLEKAAAAGLTKLNPEGRRFYAERIRLYSQQRAKMPGAVSVPFSIFSVTAPVFNRAGQHFLSITVSGMLVDTPPSRVPLLARHVAGAAAKATADLGGKHP
jgi:DNA-binding IclR family transcriptional regulator